MSSACSVVGSGKHTFEVREDWAHPPDGCEMMAASVTVDAEAALISWVWYGSSMTGETPKWVGLTDEELLELSKDAWGTDKLHIGRSDHTGFYIDFGRAVEAKLKEKNG